MKNKKLNWYTAGGVEKHYEGSFTLFGYIENNNEEDNLNWCLDWSITQIKKIMKESSEKYNEISEYIIKPQADLCLPSLSV